jgi:hypothetical protein
VRRVVVKRPGEEPAVEYVARLGFEELGVIVGGWIEIAMRGHDFFADGDLVAYVNEEGHVLDLPINVHRPSDDWPLAGPIVVVKGDRHSDDRELTEAEAEKVIALLNTMRRPA